MKRIILASTSPARKALMDTLGIAYEVEAPGVDEDVDAKTATEATQILARRKAEAVLARHPDAIVIGSDQLVWFEGEALGKPPDAERAYRQLAAMSGKVHEIVTAVCVPPSVEVDVARLTMRPLSEPELRAYVATGEWQGCAGAYRIEGQGRRLFARIDGDLTSIQGLPLNIVRALLARAGA